MMPSLTRLLNSPHWFAALVATMALTPCLGRGSLAWDTQQIQRTAKPGDKEVVASFGFKNTGTTPVTIRDIHSGCECTVAELSKRTYASGEGGSIKAIFTVGARTGQQDKMLTVTTDDPLAPTSTLNLRVDIKEVLAFSTRMLRWKIGSAPEEQFIEIRTLDQNRITTIELKDVKPKEQANVRIVPAEPGVRYRLFIQPDTLEQPRTVTLTFVAHFEGGEQQTFTVFALAR